MKDNSEQLKEKIEKAAKILDMMIEELPKTSGKFNLRLLCEDLRQARKCLE